MTFWILILSILIGTDVGLNAVILGIVTADNWDIIPEMLDPIVVYKNKKVNYFGCFVIVFIHHILFLPIAIGYWFYKLCTIGRK